MIYMYMYLDDAYCDVANQSLYTCGELLLEDVYFYLIISSILNRTLVLILHGMFLCIWVKLIMFIIGVVMSRTYMSCNSS